MIKRKILGAVCAGFCIAGAYSSEANAQATDRWTGLYGGGHVGAGWVDGADATISPANAATQAVLGPFIAAGVLPTDYSLDPEGFLAGLLMGYNWAFGSFLIGFEGDWSLLSVEDAESVNANVPAIGAVQINSDTEVNWVATLRGRLGVLAGPNLLLFATGGFAFGDVRQEGFVSSAIGASAGGRNFETATGYAVGGGAEWALSGNWSVKADYLYVSLDTDDFVITGTGGACAALNVCEFNVDTDDIELHTVRVGINYKFGHVEPPIGPMK